MHNENNLKQLSELLSNDKQKQKFSNVFVRAWNNFLMLEDLTLIVLKGHLLVEEQVRVMVYDRLLKPEELQRFSFAQYLSLAKAMYELPEGETWLWNAIAKLNQLRNAMAHELTPGDIDKKIDMFCSAVPRNEEQMPEHSVKNCISTVWISCTYFSIYKN
ncbi:hypothetical protein [Pseudidiomarina sp.]|uniref:hypothetical protein n=1 Tax=Pseudidiomarina sp. TaxID=2081707 RepID=UPI003A976918